MKFKVGDRVISEKYSDSECCYGRGEITAVNVDNTYSVMYDCGSPENRVQEDGLSFISSNQWQGAKR